MKDIEKGINNIMKFMDSDPKMIPQQLIPLLKSILFIGQISHRLYASSDDEQVKYIYLKIIKNYKNDFIFINDRILSLEDQINKWKNSLRH